MAERKKRKPAKTRQPIKKNTQPAQEVQKDIKEITFNAIQAEYLMRRAAKRYDKPETEIFLIDALNMLYDDIKGDNMTDKEKKETTENAEKIEKAGETITGKKKENISLADLQAAIKEQMPPQNSILSNENIDVMSATIKAAASVGEAVAAFSSTITAIAQSIDFQATLEAARSVFSFAKIFIDHKEELAEITGRAQEFEKETLPFIMLEVAERTGYKDTLQLTFDDICKILENGTPAGEEQAAFFNEIEKALDQFSLTGEPETPQAKELLQAALNRKAEVIEGGQAVLTINNIATALDETTTDTEQAELLKRELPELKEKLKELPKILDRKPTDLIKPTDRISNEITQPITKDKLLTAGQRRFAMVTDGTGRGVPVTLGVVFNKAQLEAAGIKADITPYDITLQQAIHTIRETCYKEGVNIGKHGEVYTTPNQIWAQMGGKSKLNKGNQRTKFFNAIQKNNTTQCDIETERLLKQYDADGKASGKDVKVKDRYAGNFIDVRIYERGIIDGRERECVIAIFSDPILTEFAADLNQISKVPLYVMQATGTLTDDNLAVANYLQHAIIYRKTHNANPTINLETLKRETGTIKRDNNLKKYVGELLTEYSHPPKGEKPFIKGFEPVKTGYKIIFDKPIKESITQKKTRSSKKKP